MKQRTKPRRPEPLTRFASKDGRQDRFAKLQHELLFERLDEVQGTDHNNRIRRAARDAAAIAWATSFPLLVFPVLFEEKASAAAESGLRQQRILEETSELLVV